MVKAVASMNIVTQIDLLAASCKDVLEMFLEAMVISWTFEESRGSILKISESLISVQLIENVWR